MTAHADRTMRAVVNTEYGGPDVLQVVDVERPVPADDEVLVEVHATTVNRTDCGFRAPWPWFIRLFAGLRRPKRTILGSEFAGVVAEVGSAVTEFAVGDEVFGVNADRFGAHAEYLCVRERAPIAPKPAGMSFEEAAAVCDGAILAMTCLTWAKLRAGQRILDLRSVRVDRHGRRPAGQAHRRPRHRGLQHRQRRDRAIARRRRGHRLHGRGLRGERPDLRHRPRRRRQEVVRRVQGIAETPVGATSRPTSARTRRTCRSCCGRGSSDRRRR